MTDQAPKAQCLMYLALPTIPDELIRSLDSNVNSYPHAPHRGRSDYRWSDHNNQQLNEWCRLHVAPGAYFAFMIMNGIQHIHKDDSCTAKLNYVIDPGGDNVITHIYNDDQQEVARFRVEPYRWHVLQTSVFHSVSGIEPGRTRFVVSAQLFPKNPQ